MHRVRPGHVPPGQRGRATREILGEPCSVSARRQMKAGYKAGAWCMINSLHVPPAWAVNGGVVFPGICHVEDRSFLIGERADVPLEMSKDWLCSEVAAFRQRPCKLMAASLNQPPSLA